MVASASFALLLASFGAAGVRAIVTPNEPGPGSVYNEGSKCHIQWVGDKDGKWDNMAIQLMTGDNFQMVHLTTVATGLDGNKDGKFDYDCPDVTPNSAIYFYQFSSPESSELTWATRFTIADAQGKSVPPENQEQPGTGAKIPWGTGALADPSSAVPPPSFLGGGGSTTNSTTSAGGSTSGESTTGSSAAPSSAGPGPSTPTMTTSVRPTATSSSGPQSTSGSSPQRNNSNSNSNNTSGNNGNSAVALGMSNTWQAALILAISASAFALFL
ncbi:hypothetical protein Moror_628 [Moniliophthora roreri MCA 2997]|uniref:Uncharacterized protein n=2 Tax=Moniliophthora roreri TaxID=221103 RepID=V2WW12_MONRO|nr:hypothetical protein Moror_628 [Moniliophthora roreri MCA 2997]KAI3616625.1 hypothetical protein WG66_011563 [Moniliophthora roreri]